MLTANVGGRSIAGSMDRSARLILTLIAAVASWNSDLMGQSTCPSLTPDSLNHIFRYAKEMFQLPANTVLSLQDQVFVDSTCYRRAWIDAEDPIVFRTQVFISPDGRFISRDLMNTRLTKSEEQAAQFLAIWKEVTESPAPIRGSKDAPVTMVLFSDFQCPYCRKMASVLKWQVLPGQQQNIRLIFRQVPSQSHDWSLLAASVAACALQQHDELFWDVHDFIFDQQHILTKANIEEVILAFLQRETQASLPRMRSCLGGSFATRAIRRDLEFARGLGVRQTPSLFVDGKQIPPESDAIIIAIQAALTSKMSAGRLSPE